MKTRFFSFTAGLLAFFPSIALAAETKQDRTAGDLGTSNDIGVPKLSFEAVAKDIISTLIYIAAVLSVLFLIIGGINYITSEGDPKKLEGAKQTVLYAIIGLVVAILAELIVAFVIAKGPQ